MDRERMLCELKELAETDAASGDERAVAEKLKPKLEELGFAVTEDRAGETFGGNCGNLLGVREGEREGSLLFAAHMDRVPNGRGIRTAVRDGFLYSDGTTILAADDLAGVCAILGGVRAAIASGGPLPRIEVLFTVAEEIGLLGAKAADLSAVRSRVGFVMDSSGPAGRAIVAAPTCAELTAEFFGRAAHAGVSPEQGADAAKALAAALSRLPTGRLDERTTANFPVIETGTKALNVVCDYAVLRGEARSHDGETLQAYAERFEAVCREAAGAFGVRAQTAAKRLMEAFSVSEESAVFRAARRACEIVGVPLRPQIGGGGMDANVLNERGIACIGLGVGYTQNHTNAERLDLAEFGRAADLAEALIGICGADAQ